MPNVSTIEQRLSQIEKEVGILKSQFHGLRSKDHWINQVSGSFKNDPEFDEILKLGRQIRQADCPDAE